MGREEIVTLRVGSRVCLFLSLLYPRPLPAPYPLNLIYPISSSLWEVATWRLLEQKHSRTRRKRLHCRLRLQWENKTKGVDKRDNAQKVMEMYDSDNDIHGDVYLQFFQ